jgi:diaminohydroxyphosphoribosylaminopyrimidine deaminase/5-amino-6-(5-phosphoribosylamino)uracil reductase
VITVPTLDGRVDLGAALEQLAAAGIYSVLCEGGATLGGALLAEDRIDRIYALVAPRLFGMEGTPAFPLKNGVSADRFSLFRIAQRGDDALLILDRCLPA